MFPTTKTKVNRKSTAPIDHRKTEVLMAKSKTTAQKDLSDPSGFWAANAEKLKRGELTSTIGMTVKTQMSSPPETIDDASTSIVASTPTPTPEVDIPSAIVSPSLEEGKSSNEDIPELFFTPRPDNVLLDEEPPIAPEPFPSNPLETVLLFVPPNTSVPVHVATSGSAESSRATTPLLSGAEYPALNTARSTSPFAASSGLQFLSNEMIQKLQAAPPAPPRKDFDTAIKNGGHIVKGPQTQVLQSNASKKGSTGPKSRKMFRPAKTATIPVIDPEKDVRTYYSRESRLPFANGRDLPVIFGTKNLGTVPEYMYRQCSSTGNGLFMKAPTTDYLTVAEGSADVVALVKIIDWLNDICHSRFVRMISFTETEELENLELCRTARVIGLNDRYVGHIARRFQNIIRDTVLSNELITSIAKLAEPGNDDIYNALVDNMAYRRRRGTGTEFGEILAMLPTLADAVSKAGDKSPRRRP
jgi:hypothetical protein